MTLPTTMTTNMNTTTTRLSGRRRMHAVKQCVRAITCIAVLASCSGTNGDASRPLNRTEAETLAQVLYRNYEAKGAVFELSTRALSGSGTVTLSGMVNWENHSGVAVVNGYGAGDGVVEAIAWTANAIAEKRPAWADRLMGKDPQSFFARPVAIDSQQLDRLVAVVVGLAGTQPENAQLILQNEGAQFVRTDTLRNTEAIVLRYSPKLLYWCDAQTGQMLRMEATDSTGTWPIVVDIVKTGPQEIPLPPTVPYPR